MPDKQDKPKMDIDEPVNAEMDPEDALRLLLGEERRGDDADDSAESGDSPEEVG